MHSRNPHDLPIAATDENGLAADSDLSILRDVLRMLPAGVTVQDEHGRFLLVNDAAAAHLRIAAGDPAAPPSPELSQRRETGLELLRTGRAAVTEECVNSGEARQILLTAHLPVRIADRNLLISSSTDISEQKTLEDHLF